jgi:hypothetical protein
LQGRTWDEVLMGDQSPKLVPLIEREINLRIEAEYRHIDKKNELLSAYKEFATARFRDSGGNYQDSGYQLLQGMGGSVKAIIGMPS